MSKHSNGNNSNVATKSGNKSAAENTGILDREESVATDFEINGSQKDSLTSNASKTTYNFVIDQIPYIVSVQPFTLNEQSRFYIQVNNGPEHVFTWDEQLKTIRSIDEDASLLPDELEEEISRKLQAQQNKRMK